MTKQSLNGKTKDGKMAGKTSGQIRGQCSGKGNNKSLRQASAMLKSSGKSGDSAGKSSGSSGKSTKSSGKSTASPGKPSGSPGKSTGSSGKPSVPSGKSSVPSGKSTDATVKSSKYIKPPCTAQKSQITPKPSKNDTHVTPDVANSRVVPGNDLWLEVRDLVKIVYKTSRNIVAPAIGNRITHIMNGLCERDAFQLHIRLELLVKEIVVHMLEASDGVIRWQNNASCTLCQAFIENVMYDAEGVRFGASLLEPLLIRFTDIHLKKVNMTWMQMNLNIFRMIYLENARVRERVRYAQDALMSQIDQNPSYKRTMYKFAQLVNELNAAMDEMVSSMDEVAKDSWKIRRHMLVDTWQDVKTNETKKETDKPKETKVNRTEKRLKSERIDQKPPDSKAKPTKKPLENAEKKKKVKQTVTPAKPVSELDKIVNFVNGAPVTTETTVDVKLTEKMLKKKAKKEKQREKKKMEKETDVTDVTNTNDILKFTGKECYDDDKVKLSYLDDELISGLNFPSSPRPQPQQVYPKTATVATPPIDELVSDPKTRMVTIRRVNQLNSDEPTVTITLKGATPNEDKVLYRIVNGQADYLDARVFTDHLSSSVGSPDSKIMTNADKPPALTKTQLKKQRKKARLGLNKEVDNTRMYMCSCHAGEPVTNGNHDCADNRFGVRPVGRNVTDPDLKSGYSPARNGYANGHVSRKDFNVDKKKDKPYTENSIGEQFIPGNLKLPAGITITKIVQPDDEIKRRDEHWNNHVECVTCENGSVNGPDMNDTCERTSSSASNEIVTDDAHVPTDPAIPDDFNIPNRSLTSLLDASLLMRPNVGATSLFTWPYFASWRDHWPTKTHVDASELLPIWTKTERCRAGADVFVPLDIDLDGLDADEREIEEFKRFCNAPITPVRKEATFLNVDEIVSRKTAP